MAAKLVFKRRFFIRLKNGRVISVFMDLYKIEKISTENVFENYRFSWIAFDPETPSRRILFDSHPPKGPHIHVDDMDHDEPFKWSSLEDTKELFLSRIKSHFGEVEEEGNL